MISSQDLWRNKRKWRGREGLKQRRGKESRRGKGFGGCRCMLAHEGFFVCSCASWSCRDWEDLVSLLLPSLRKLRKERERESGG